MTSIGNDIVDLHHVNPERSQNKRFYQKFITESEIALYHSFPAGQLTLTNFVWLLWSVKESGYKLFQRYQPGLVFSPTKIMIDRIDLSADASPSADIPPVLESTGFSGFSTWNVVAHFGEVSFYARSIVNGRYIATVALPVNSFDLVMWGVKLTEDETPAQQSTDARLLLTNRTKSILGNREYTVRKNANGCPLLFCDDAEMDWMISLAHHGRVVGYAGITD